MYVVNPSLEFNCSGNITSFLLHVDVRTETNNSEYLTIWLWNKIDYSCVVDSSVEIILGPSNFNTDRVYQLLFNSLQIKCWEYINQLVKIVWLDFIIRIIMVRIFMKLMRMMSIHTLNNEDMQTNKRPLIYSETSIMIIKTFNILAF